MHDIGAKFPACRSPKKDLHVCLDWPLICKVAKLLRIDTWDEHHLHPPCEIPNAHTANPTYGALIAVYSANIDF